MMRLSVLKNHKGRHDEIERIKKDPEYLRVILEKERSEKQE